MTPSLPPFWRSGWDSNPRAATNRKLISSQPRYDHFDTAPCCASLNAPWEMGGHSRPLLQVEPPHTHGVSTAASPESIAALASALFRPPRCRFIGPRPYGPDKAVQASMGIIPYRLKKSNAPAARPFAPGPPRPRGRARLRQTLLLKNRSPFRAAA